MRGACDCHVHVFGPPGRYPLSPERRYTPPQASVEELLALQERLGLERVVIVQPSPYGTDNGCMLDALRRLGRRARGVAVIDEHSSLVSMHEAGVRGVRVNLETGGERDPAVALRKLEQAAARVAPLGWHVQTFASLQVLSTLKSSIEALPVPLVVDHFGLPSPGADYAAVVSLVRSGKAYVKLSAPHRFAVQPDYADAEPFVRALLAANPERLLWGSDWPHPGTGPRERPRDIQPFDAVDDARALERLAGWVSSPAQLEKILVTNPARLYDF